MKIDDEQKSGIKILAEDREQLKQLVLQAMEMKRHPGGDDETYELVRKQIHVLQTEIAKRQELFDHLTKRVSALQEKQSGTVMEIMTEWR